MKKIRIEDAVGHVICHDITEMRDGFKGPAFRRGHVIQESDLDKLMDIGKKHVFVWEDSAGEIHEEDAVLRMSGSVGTTNASFGKPSEGKQILRADCDGMYRVNKELLAKLNSIDDVTVSSIPDHYPVKAGARLASMRIIPLVTKEANIEKYEAYAEGNWLFDVRPYRELKAGVIITGSEVYSGRIKDKFEPVARKKLGAYPCDIIGVEFCDDKLEMLLDKARSFVDAGADLIIFSGGMSVDPDDLTPTAIRELGADIVAYGVPSQPGNMTLVAYLGDIAILGVPGAAISMPTTIFDVVLPQIFAGDKFTKEELYNLAEGGLCQLCAECHFPNCTFGRY